MENESPSGCNGHVDPIHLDDTGYQSHGTTPEELFPAVTLADSSMRRSNTATGKNNFSTF